MDNAGDSPSVSIVIPFLSGEFLREAIESVLSQTFADWELLLVDDGCVDQGTAIAKSFAAQHPGRIRCLTHEGHQNEGVCASRNLGVRSSSAAFVALLDADDLWLPRKLEEQVALMKTHPSVALVFGCTHYHSDSHVGGDFIECPSLEMNRVYDPPELLLSCSLGSEPLPSMSNVMFRRDAFDELGGFEEDFVEVNRLYEDQAFVAKFFVHKQVYIADQCWDVYRRHARSFTFTAEHAPSASLARRFYLNWLTGYLQQCGITNDDIMKLLHHARLPYEYPRLYWLSLPLRAVRRWFLERAKTKRRLPVS